MGAGVDVPGAVPAPICWDSGRSVAGQGQLSSVYFRRNQMHAMSRFRNENNGTGMDERETAE